MKKRTDILLLLPSLCGFMAFFVVPFFCSFYYAFTENAFSTKFVWFDNFISLFQNGYFQLAMKNTLIFTAIAVPLIMLMSILTALLLVHFSKKMHFVESAFFLPVFLPSAAVIMLWNAFLAEIPPFSSLLIIFLWKYSGLNIVLILTALTGMNRDVIEAAKIDGANVFRQTWSITLPSIAPTLFFTMILSVVNSLKIFRESYLLYGNYPEENVYTLQNYLNNHFAKLNYQNISTAAIFFAVIVYTVVAVMLRLERNYDQ